jgi:hypothetical protein
MADFEKLGVFYLGREYDLEAKAPRAGLLLYDSRDLVTHAVCVGMTGSGKTGLCVALLEEAAIDGVPAIVVDPKGDLTNLLLTFPELRPEDFRPWINEEDASRKGIAPDAYAAQQAQQWRDGLAQWGQDAARLRRLRESAEFTIYTPGSNAGVPVSILRSLAVPPKTILDDDELLAERITTTVTGLLSLLGLEADPLQSREHILLSTILGVAWRAGRDLDLAGFIQAIQKPAVDRIGVFDLESFFPEKDRFGLAMKVNNLLAAPGFAAWLEGEPLDIDRIYHTPAGGPRVSIFSIAHLGDAERMFFVSLLLTQLLGWMRSQSGTTSLRALFYMDEIFGYFPPVANPPAKAPLLTLLKQARAFGLGIVLTTQNPVDLDYKGLANTGTWFIGRLQTDRDKQRLLDGLEGAAAGAAGRFDRARMEQTLAGLGSRVFLMNNVHDDAPVAFQSRWAMSYLCGPLTREQIRELMSGRRVESVFAAPPVAIPTPAPAASPRPAAATVVGAAPVLPPEVPQHFLPVPAGVPEGAAVVYAPMLLATARVYYSNAKLGVATQRETTRLVPLRDAPSGVDWDQARELTVAEVDLGSAPRPGAAFGSLPREAAAARSYPAWAAAFKDWLYRNQKLTLWKSPATRLVSSVGEGEREFRLRLAQAGRERRDALVQKLRARYATRIATLEDRVRRAEAAVQREQGHVKQQEMQAAISLGATILDALGGRRGGTLGRATTTARGAGRVMREKQDVQRAAQNRETLKAQLAQLQAEVEAEVARLAGGDPLSEVLQAVEIAPKKMDVTVDRVILVWVPTA